MDSFLSGVRGDDSVDVDDQEKNVRRREVRVVARAIGGGGEAGE